MWICEKCNEENEDTEEEPELIFSPPIVVLINSGMEIAVPEKKEESTMKQQF